MNAVKMLSKAMLVGCVAVSGGGCASSIVDASMAAHGFKKATREEMLAPATASFPAPVPKAVRPSLPKEKLVGKWACSFVLDSRHALLSMGYNGSSSTMISHQAYTFFDDGDCRLTTNIGGKETTWNGNWDYRDGVLKIVCSSGDGTTCDFDLSVLWYGEDEFEIRYADVEKYRQMLMKPDNIKSVRCRYESNGVFHTEMIISADGNESAVIMVQSPMIYERESGAE